MANVVHVAASIRTKAMPARRLSATIGALTSGSTT